jgi:hypothetical protein
MSGIEDFGKLDTESVGILLEDPGITLLVLAMWSSSDVWYARAVGTIQHNNIVEEKVLKYVDVACAGSLDGGNKLILDICDMGSSLRPHYTPTPLGNMRMKELVGDLLRRGAHDLSKLRVIE